MEKEYDIWTIRELLEKIDNIEFPEFQREPSVWGLGKRQKLIDSILRDFDIAPIYLYLNDEAGTLDCIDGRQRITSILSFLGENEGDENGGLELNNNFKFKTFNEIFEDDRFEKLDGLRYDEFPTKFKNIILNFNLNIIIIKNVKYTEELNLLFLRLQLGSVLNAGEKLHAMRGDIRDFVFDIGKKHPFFKGLKIPSRRFAREQVCAQIAINAFSKKEKGFFSTCRYYELQEFFKEKSDLSYDGKNILREMKEKLDIIHKNIGDRLAIIKNRAIAVSTYLIIDEMIDKKPYDEIPLFVNFLEEFLKALNWQIKKGVKMDEEYYDFLSFQTFILQAAVQKKAIHRRHEFLKEYFDYFKKNNGAIKGDLEYQKRTKKEPKKERKYEMKRET